VRKIWLIATTEFTTIVRSKAFLFGLFVLPTLMAMMLFFQGRAAVKSAERRDQASVEALTRTFVLTVIDTKKLCGAQFVEAATSYNQRALSLGRARLALTILQPDTSEALDKLKNSLAEQLKRGLLNGYIELPVELLEESTKEVSFYTDDDLSLGGLLRRMLNDCVKTQKLRRAGVSDDQIKEAERFLALTPKSRAHPPASNDSNPEIEAAARILKVLGFVVPAGMVFFMFIMVMMSVQPLLTTVLEEKMSRISEVLLGMVNPFELMMGKLLASLGASLIVAVLYVGSGVGVLLYLGYLSMVPWEAFVCFVIFMFPAVFFFGSIYLAVGAACNDVKDAQALLTPFMLLMMVPLFVVPFAMSEPDGVMSTVLSLLPPATPFLMLMRVSMNPGPPTWQVVLSLVLTLLTAALFVFAAGKIFRAGLLMQGKAPTLREMLKWVLK
jgi:ABC-2 type transport system permease protein